MPGKPKSPLEQIRHIASQIRHANPKKYGVTGAKKGDIKGGYKKDGFKKALHDASIIWRREHGK